jgi:hypothetical protein
VSDFEITRLREALRDAELRCDNWRNDHERLRVEREQTVAAMREHFGIEDDDDLLSGYWLPAEPGPVLCASLADVVREYARLVANDHARKGGGE